jgi:hypothetical protein
MSLPKTLPFRRPLAIPDAERVWFGRFVFPVAEWLKMIWLSGNGLAGERRQYPMHYSMNLMVEARNGQ